MSDIKISVTNIHELNQKLDEHSKQLTRKIAYDGLFYGANSMRNKIILAAPKKTGRTKRAVIIYKSKINTPEKNKKAGYGVVVKEGKSRKDLTGSWYAQFIERGFNRGSKRVSKADALRLDVTTESIHQSKHIAGKLLGIRNYKPTYRAGGKPVKPLYFVKNTFKNNYRNVLNKIINRIEFLAKQHLAKNK